MGNGWCVDFFSRVSNDMGSLYECGSEHFIYRLNWVSTQIATDNRLLGGCSTIAAYITTAAYSLRNKLVWAERIRRLKPLHWLIEQGLEQDSDDDRATPVRPERYIKQEKQDQLAMWKRRVRTGVVDEQIDFGRDEFELLDGAADGLERGQVEPERRDAPAGLRWNLARRILGFDHVPARDDHVGTCSDGGAAESVASLAVGTPTNLNTPTATSSALGWRTNSPKAARHDGVLLSHKRVRSTPLIVGLEGKVGFNMAGLARWIPIFGTCWINQGRLESFRVIDRAEQRSIIHRLLCKCCWSKEVEGGGGLSTKLEARLDRCRSRLWNGFRKRPCVALHWTPLRHKPTRSSTCPQSQEELTKKNLVSQVWWRKNCWLCAPPTSQNRVDPIDQRSTFFFLNQTSWLQRNGAVFGTPSTFFLARVDFYGLWQKPSEILILNLTFSRNYDLRLGFLKWSKMNSEKCGSWSAVKGHPVNQEMYC